MLISKISGAFKNYAERLAEAQEGIAELGLIVRTEKEYSVIWSPKHDLVRAQMTGADENDKVNWGLKNSNNVRNNFGKGCL